MSRSLIVLPDDTALPIVAAIDAAQKSLRVKMFLFSDPALLDALKRARKRGVAVRVMLNPARRSGEEEHVAARKAIPHATRGASPRRRSRWSSTTTRRS